MRNPDHAHFAEWDAAYVLGGLNPAERREFEDHLDECERCRGAVHELSGLPGLLGRIDDARAFALLEAEDDGDAAPEEAVAAIRSLGRRRRVRRIGLSIGAIAAAAALASALTVVVPQLFQRGPDTVVAMSEVAGQNVPVTMTVAASAADWGTELHVDCFYAPVVTADGGYGPAAYSLWVVGTDGSETSVSTWNAEPNTGVKLDASTATALADIAALQLRTLDGGQTLLEANLTS